MNFLLISTLLATESKLKPSINENYGVLYHTFIYRLKITCRSILKKETDLLYNQITNLEVYDHKKYFSTLYIDFKSILNIPSSLSNMVFSEYLKELLEAEDLKLEKKILNYATYSLKASVNLISVNNINAHLFRTQKNLNLQYLLFLRQKFKVFLKKSKEVTILVPELSIILFYTFSLLDFADEKRISMVLSKLSVIYAVILKNENSEILDLAYFYNILNELLYNLISYPHFSTEFTILKEKILSQNEDKMILRKFGIFFILENHLKSKIEGLKCEIPNIENEQVFENLDKLITLFYSFI